MEKICKVHGLTEYRASKDKPNGRCLKCSVDAVQRRRRKIKQQSIEYKGDSCAHCNGRFHPAVYEFHHRDPTKKDFALGSGGICRSWDAIKLELDKCDMLCANCHRMEHVRIGDLP